MWKLTGGRQFLTDCGVCRFSGLPVPQENRFALIVQPDAPDLAGGRFQYAADHTQKSRLMLFEEINRLICRIEEGDSMCLN